MRRAGEMERIQFSILPITFKKCLLGNFNFPIEMSLNVKGVCLVLINPYLEENAFIYTNPLIYKHSVNL